MSTAPSRSAWRGERPAGVEGDDVLEGEPVPVAQADEAQRPRGALSGPTEGEVLVDLREIAQLSQPFTVRSRSCHEESVGVLRR